MDLWGCPMGSTDRRIEMNNTPAILYAGAATMWLVLGFLTWNIIYLILAAVFYVLAIKKRKKRED